MLKQYVKPLFERYNVRAYFNGHDHDLQHVLVDGVHYLASGSGASTRDTGEVPGTLFADDSLGFRSARLTQAAMEIECIDDKGSALCAYRIPS